MTHYNQSFVAKGGLTVSAAEDSVTNANYFPLFGTQAVGSLTIKASSTKLSFNPSTGLLSATALAGNGSSLTNLNGTAITTGVVPIARGGTGTSTATGTGNLVLASSPTITGLTATGLTVNGAFNVTSGITVQAGSLNISQGNLSVAGTIASGYVDADVRRAASLKSSGSDARTLTMAAIGSTANPAWIWGALGDGLSGQLFSTGYLNVAYANQANSVNGWTIDALVRRADSNQYDMYWDGGAIQLRVNTGAQNVRTHWSVVGGRPTDLGQFSNNPQFINRDLSRGGSAYFGEGSGAGSYGYGMIDVTGRVGRWNVGNGFLEVAIDGRLYSINVSPSDERLKKNIKPTSEDSLAKINRIDISEFEYTEDIQMFAGIKRNSGLLAQQIEKIDPDWIIDGASHKELQISTLLTSALHAIQQLSKKNDALEARISALEA